MIAPYIALVIATALGQIPERPPIEQMPIYATAYNWNLGGINCNEDCGEVAIGLATSDDLLNHTAACPLEWLGRINTTAVTLPDGSEWYCIDTFGSAENQQPVFISHPYHGDLWVIRIDFAVSDPASFEYNQQLIYGWSTEWQSVSDLGEDN
jgi:hypothetical protein